MKFITTTYKPNGRESFPPSRKVSEDARHVANSIFQGGKTRASKREAERVLDYKQLKLFRETQADYDDINLEELESIELIRVEKKNIANKENPYANCLIIYNYDNLSKFIIECDWADVFDKDVAESM